MLFTFLTGNADMHLKNFSLLHTPSLGYGLAPAYGLVATALVNPADTEELALTLNGRKKKLKPADLELAAQRAGVTEKVLTGLFAKFTRLSRSGTTSLTIAFCRRSCSKDIIHCWTAGLRSWD